MGNKALTSADVEVTGEFVHLADSKNKFNDVKIPLCRLLNVKLVPQFTTADIPGKTITYRLQMELCRKNQVIDTSVSPSWSGSEQDYDEEEEEGDEDGSLMVVVKFTEIVTRERRISTVGITHRRSIVKSNSWNGRTKDVFIDKKRMRLKGKLRQDDIADSESSLLDFDLILCPSDLIIPDSKNEWLLMGTLYVSNLKENKNYKWRAAVAKNESNE